LVGIQYDILFLQINNRKFQVVSVERRALSKAEMADEDALAYKLIGNWNPKTKITFQELILDEKSSDYLSKPIFYLAYPERRSQNPEDWSVEHKWMRFAVHNP
jgi:hypothetical protein